METLKTLSDYSIDFNRGFQGFSIANLEKGRIHTGGMAKSADISTTQSATEAANITAVLKTVTGANIEKRKWQGNLHKPLCKIADGKYKQTIDEHLWWFISFCGGSIVELRE